MKPKYLELTPEDAIKAKEAAKKREASVVKVPLEYLALAELGVEFGWGAVRDVMNDNITLEQAYMFIAAARKVNASKVYDSAVAALAGNTTKPKDFNDLMKNYRLLMRNDNE